jgi:hypothetical protein
MENPDSSHQFRRTCPVCHRTVEPGFKFCKTCGTRIPELSTCSKCGTRFIAPVKYCDLCGARVIPDVPEPPESPEYSREVDNPPAGGQALDQYEEEIPEPDSDELPEDPGEETLGPAEHETPHHAHEEIQEPDTDDLLEQFGKEYDDDETLESFHQPKSGSLLKHEAKKPGPAHSLPGPGSPEVVDDALFLSPGKNEAPGKPELTRRRIIVAGMVLVVFIAAVYLIGLPLFSGSGGFGAHRNLTAVEVTPLATPVGTIPPAMTTTPVPVPKALVPLPTQLMPPGPDLYFQVQKNPVTARITVIFTGSAGQGSLSSADIRVTHPDGSIATGIIQPLKGVTEITLDGSKETDRVEILAKMSSGETYRVRDELVPLMGL